MSSILHLCAILATLILVGTVQAQNKYSDKVRACYEKDKANFNACLLQFWKDIKPDLAKGIPELKIPPLDPMTIDNIQFNEQAAVVQVTATFSKVLVKGASVHDTKSVNVDFPSKTVKIVIAFPALYITGTYNVDGTILLLPVKGNGPFTLNLTNIDGIATANLERVGNSVKIAKLDVEFKIQGIKIALEGLLGDDTVGEAVRNMLNDNSQQILDDVRPKVQQQLSDAILKVLSEGFVDLPPEAFGV